LPRKRAFVFCGKTSCCLHSYRTKPVSMDLMVKSMGIHVFFHQRKVVPVDVALNQCSEERCKNGGFNHQT
jgi:hypothetical protein